MWKALYRRLDLSMVVGASAGAWNGWLIAAGASPDELAEAWLDPSAARVLVPSLRGERLRAKAREIYDRYRPRMRYGLTVTAFPRMRQQLVEGESVTWQHLAATCAIPLVFPPVGIAGRKFYDGGLGGALPLWAAEQMGATECIALHCLNTLPFRLLRQVVRPRRTGPALRVRLIEPSQPLGSIRDAHVWSAANVRRYIELGERDGNRALPSITM